LKLLSLGSLNGANACARTAFDALICVDYVLVVALSDAFYGASILACAACDALICNYICHNGHLHFLVQYIIAHLFLNCNIF